MNHYLFHDEVTLAEKTQELGKQAVKLKLIPAFVIRYYPDSWEFCIPNYDNSSTDCLTAPEAYLKLKKLVDSALSIV
ncbi:hypothetical protein CLI64_15115 [Nostoc sp. CENA543]|uniref:hypothetical protein n=1 Tax=Nostoc sp. CENA543 TaxID=1869241 RepID=UPI000CA3B8F7|nr:hypothetical protein [Nostoc sp. CENA543]AUT01609.1 hypothetical protein CLI64_15115 [Nostoc sp. CENA543]